MPLFAGGRGATAGFAGPTSPTPTLPSPASPMESISTTYVYRQYTFLFPFHSRIHFFSKQAKVCCSYAAPSALTGVQGFDCVHIPNALSNGANGVPEMSHLCGNNLGLPGATRCCEGEKFLYLQNLEFIALIDLLKHQFLQDQLFPCSFFCSLKNQTFIPWGVLIFFYQKSFQLSAAPTRSTSAPTSGR